MNPDTLPDMDGLEISTLNHARDAMIARPASRVRDVQLQLARVIRLSASVLALTAATMTARADTLSDLWSIATGERGYVGTANTERGMAYNPRSGQLLLVSRAESSLGAIYVLNGQTGAEVGVLKNTAQDSSTGEETNVIGGGLFGLNLVGVADDGAVYGGNLSTDLARPLFKLYRWASDNLTNSPVVAFSGDPGVTNVVVSNGQTNYQSNLQRWGDTLAVRGAGTNTQVLLASRSGTILALLTTTDGTNFISKVITSDATGGDMGLGLAWGKGNTIWTKAPSRSLRHLQLDISAARATTLRVITSLPGTAAALGVDPANNRLAVVNYGAHEVIFLDISDPAGLIEQDREALPGPPTANGNGTGAASFGPDLLFALDTNNGLTAKRIDKPVVAEPPAIIRQPASRTVYAGATVTFTIGVTGTAPLAYQWLLEGTNLPGATSAELRLTNVQPSQAGYYSVIVTNTAGAATSTDAALTVRSPVASDALTPLWSLAPGSRPYINTDNTQRGIAYNPVTTNLLLISRTLGATNIYVLDANTGAEKWRLRVADDDGARIVSGGDFLLNMIGVAGDGAVYAANLITDIAAGNLRVYRWANDGSNTIPTVAYANDPGNGGGVATRWGDSMDVRGAGNNTQIIVGAGGTANIVSILTTDNGTDFISRPITVEGAPSRGFALGIAFGETNSFWGKANGTALTHASFDLSTGTGVILETFPTSVFPGAVSPIAINAQRDLLAGIALETPDNIQLFDIAVLGETNAPVLLDQELIFIDNANDNGTGSLDFGPGRLFALDSNNGLHAYALTDQSAPPLSLSIARQGNQVTLRWEGQAVLQSAPAVSGPWNDVAGAASPHQVDTSASAMRFWRLRR